VIDGTTTIVCSSWFSRSIERQSGTSLRWSSSNRCCLSFHSSVVVATPSVISPPLR
jgi:hypothetical protein